MNTIFKTASRVAPELHAPAMPGAVFPFSAGASGNAMDNATFEWSIFGSHAADRIMRERGTWSDILNCIKDTSRQHASKSVCPWVKMAKFGDKRSKYNSLRHDANIIEIFGVEGDYDGEVMTPEQGLQRLEAAQIKAAIYTSPSHTADKPRWRVLAPLSQSHQPSARYALLARINGVLGGVLANESFTLSQSYFFGQVVGADYRVLVTFDDPDEGSFVDELDGLDDIAIGRRAAVADVAYQQAGGVAAPVATRYVSQEQAMEIREALRFIDPDDYHQWIAVGQTLRGVTPDTLGFGLWDEWSSRSEKYNKAEMGKRWRGFAPRALNIETIFYRAQQGGWINPLGKAATDRETRLTELAQQAQQQPALVPLAMVAERVDVVRPFPVPQLDELCAWIGRTQGIKPGVAAQMAALSVASLAASRLYVSEFGDGAHLYQLLCAHSVVDLLPLTKATTQILKDSGLRKMMREQRFTSPASLYKTLMRSPATLWQTSEFGTMASFAKRQSSGQLDHVFNLMVNAYQQDDICIDNAEELSMKGAVGIDDDMPVIRRPALSLFALTSHAMLPSSFTSAEIGRGGIEQMLFHSAEVFFEGESNPESTPLWLINHIRLIRQLPAWEFGQDASGYVPDLDLASIFNGNAQLLPTQRRVRFDAHPSEHYRKFDEMCHGNRSAKPLANGSRIALRRMAVALAAWGNPQAPVVTRHVLDWCALFVADRLSESLSALHFSGGSDDGKSSIYQNILQAVAQAGGNGITQTELVRAIYKFRALPSVKRDELVAQLLEDGEVVEQRNSNGKGTRFFAVAAMGDSKMIAKHEQNTQNTKTKHVESLLKSTTYEQNTQNTNA